MSGKRSRRWLLLFLLLLVIVVPLTFDHFRNGSSGGRGPGKNEAQVAKFFRKMSVEKKVGQTILAYFTGIE